MSNKIVVVDFDETLYKYDSLIRFCLYIYIKKPKQSIYILKQVFAFILNLLGIINTKKYKQLFLCFATNINHDELYKLSIDFWEREHPNNFNKEILNVINSSTRTICISASPELYLKYICEKLNIELIGTRIEYENSTYKIVGENCKAEEKVKRLNEYISNKEYEIESCYSDSMTDMPLFKIAKNAYLVKSKEIIKL